ncbi:3-dehydroquinate synthase II [Methanosphaerula subterraneus]|uniref:3-dehydroquinate synthase II n=1 Tax=Methanosphaerula subterraneus TaxID=3350244 RepID=UPI003F832054
MKQLWVDLSCWNKDLATAALEAGVDAIIVDEAAKVKVLAKVTTIAPDGDLVPGKDVSMVTIKDKASEEECLEKAKLGPVVVSTKDWTVIPLENLVAQSDRIYAAVGSAEEARLALTILEQGVAGVVLTTTDPGVIRTVAAMVRGAGAKVPLVPFTLTAVRQLGMGDRVCIDTCSILADGEGMLVGNTSSAFFLVHAETIENPYVAPRPFRVNAGAVHAYVLTPGNRTAYLADLRAGDLVTVAAADGGTEEVIIGRLKIEKRPLLLVEGEAGGVKAGLVLQNAETIRLVGLDGKARSVVDLKPGDQVLGMVAEGGRHFGYAVKEQICEQ